MTRIEARSRLLCLRCGHSEDEHNWQTGPCSHTDSTSPLWPFYQTQTRCDCYAFVSKFKAAATPGFAEAAVEAGAGQVLSIDDITREQWTVIFILLHAAGQL